MEKLAANPAELPQLREYGVSYPPVSFILYETSPYTYSEALFLYLVYKRRSLTHSDILVGSLLENFESSLKISAIPTPLTRKLQSLLQEPNIHYRQYDDPMEIVKTVDLHFRSVGHVYLYSVDPAETTDDYLMSLSNLIKKIKNYMTRSFTITIFLDETSVNTKIGKRLSYQAELIFRLKRAEKTVSSLLSIMKTKFVEVPSITIEYNIGKEDLSFQVIRAI